MPKYSIIIPTRNREEYLPHAIESVLSSSRSDIELIVSDNHSSDATEKYLSTLKDSRLKIIRPDEELPISLHYEFTLIHATGEWITILGADDAIMPWLFDRVDELQNQYPRISMIASRRAYYFWPGCEEKYGNKVFSYNADSRLSLRSTKRDLLAVLIGLRLCFDMPQIYTTSMVKKELVDRIKKKSGGRFYHSITPDMYSVTALCLEEDRYLRTEEPLFWVGTSNSSTGASGQIYKDAELKKESGTSGHPVLRLHPGIVQGLHNLVFGSLYIFESLLCCPYASKIWKSTTLAKIVLADVHEKLEKNAIRRKVTPAQAQVLFNEQLTRTGLTQNSIDFAGRLLPIIRKAVNKIRIGIKIKKFGTRSESFMSKDREKFRTISDAIEFIATSVKSNPR